jgi:hypothetical protein
VKRVIFLMLLNRLLDLSSNRAAGKWKTDSTIEGEDSFLIAASFLPCDGLTGNSAVAKGASFCDALCVALRQE